jgi:hypothetical protein
LLRVGIVRRNPDCPAGGQDANAAHEGSPRKATNHHCDAQLRSRSLLRTSRAAHAAHCTARHGVGSHAEPPTMEWGDPDREEVRAPVASRVGRELHIPALVSHAGDDEPDVGPGVEVMERRLKS